MTIPVRGHVSVRTINFGNLPKQPDIGPNCEHSGGFPWPKTNTRMRQILENIITLIVAAISFVLCWFWYCENHEIEPIVGMVTSGGAFLAGIMFRFFPEKPELAKPLVHTQTTIENGKNVVTDAPISAGRDVSIGDQTNIHNEGDTITNNIYGDTKPVPRLLTAPAAAIPSSFRGREKELADIRKLLTRQNTLALVNAEGGMGKTTLAARYWQQYESQYQHLAWLFCDSGILAAMRDQLPYALGLVETLNQYADNPEKQAQVIKTTMANLPKDCLLVLDNANQEEHILGFQKLMSGLGWHVLITSRCSKVLPDSEYKITGLPPAQAKALFKEFHDEKTPEFETLLERFLIAVDYNTLCIEVFSKNLREGAGWGLTFETLLQKLETNGLFMGEHSFEIQTEWANSTQKEAVKSTDQVIEALYNVADLQQRHPELHELLSTFSLLPAENHPPQVLGELLAPDDKPGLKRSLDQLTQKGWLSTDRSTYRISPVVQKILLQRNVERRWELGEPMVKRLQAVFETEGYHSKNIATAGPFVELVFGLIDNLNVAEEELASLLNNLWVYHTVTGNLTKAMDTAEKMQKFCTAHDLKHALAISLNKLGETHSALGNLPQALTFFEERSRLGKELHEAYPQNVSFKNGLAISYEKLGSTHIALGNLPQALIFFEQLNQLEKELHEAYPQNVEFKNVLAISYYKLGQLYEKKEDFQKAFECYEQDLKFTKMAYETSPSNAQFREYLKISYNQMGHISQKLGKTSLSKEYFELEKSLD